MQAHQVFELMVEGLTFGSIYALLGLSINIIYSASYVVNFAQGELMMLGSMFGVTYFTVRHLPYVGAALLVMASVGAIGWLEYAVMVKPLARRNAPIISIIIATLGASIVLKISAALTWGGVERFAEAPLGATPLHMLGLQVLPQSGLVLALTAAVLLGTFWFYNYTIFGLAIRATAMRVDGARLMGINVGGVVALSFIVGAAVAGLAGLILSPLTYASPWLGLQYAVRGFAAAIVGGLGNWAGAVLGGLVLAIFEVMAVHFLGSYWGDGLTFALILLILYVRPSGLLPGIVEES